MKIIVLRFFSLILAILPISGYSAVFHCIDTTTSLKCTLSSNHHNRIVVDGGEIKKIVSADSELSISMEPESGQAFIYSLLPMPRETALSVITKEGNVQDIEINFQEGSPEVIILTQPAFFEEGGDEIVGIEDLVMKDQIIDSLLNGKIPSGYSLSAIERTRGRLQKCLWIEAISLISSPIEDIYLYEIINNTNTSQTVTENQLEGCDSRWVYLETGKIKPKSKALAIVSYNVRQK